MALPPGWRGADDRVEVWPCMAPAVTLFLALSTQWRTASAGMAGSVMTGLDYGAVKPTAELAGVEVTPEVFVDLRAMEAESLKIWARQR